MKSKARKIISLMLSMALLVGLFPAMPMPAYGSYNDAPQNLSVPPLAFDESKIVLTWEKPDDYYESTVKIVDYEVFRDGLSLGLASDNFKQNYAYVQAYMDAFYRNLDPNHHRISILSFTATGLAPQTKYEFMVRAIYADQTTSAFSAPLSFSTTSVPIVIDAAAHGATYITEKSGDYIIRRANNNETVIKSIEDNTAAIQAAIDATPVGGKVVLKGSGNNASPWYYPSGSLFLHSNMTFEVEEGAVLLGSPVFDHYPRSLLVYPYSQDIRTYGLLNAVTWDYGSLENIRIVGKGAIDGNGWKNAASGGGLQNKTTVDPSPDFDDPTGNGWRLPNYQAGSNSTVDGISSSDSASVRGILAADAMWQSRQDQTPNAGVSQFYNTRPNLTVARGVNGLYYEGLTFYNPAFHGIVNYQSEQITANGVVGMMFDANNGDGIEFGDCLHLIVMNSFWDTGDDAINFAAGQGTVVRNLTDKVASGEGRVFNNFVRNGHGGLLAMGSHTGGWIGDMIAEENVYNSSESGSNGVLRLKSGATTGGGVRNIIVRDNAVNYTLGGNRTIVIDTSYSDGNASTAFGPESEQPLTFENVLVRNMTVSNTNVPLIQTAAPGSSGYAKSPVLRNFTFEDIKILSYTGSNGGTITIDGMSDVTFRNITGLQRAITINNSKNITIENSEKTTNRIPDVLNWDGPLTVTVDTYLANVTWPTVSIATQYAIFVDMLDGHGYQQKEIVARTGSESESATIALRPNTSYKVAIRPETTGANASYGILQEASVITGGTSFGESTTLIAPPNFKVRAPNTTGISWQDFTWGAVTDAVYGVHYYELTAAPRDSTYAVKTYKAYFDHPGRIGYSLWGLDDGVTYDVTLKAVNWIGQEGPAAGPITITTVPGTLMQIPTWVPGSQLTVSGGRWVGEDMIITWNENDVTDYSNNDTARFAGYRVMINGVPVDGGTVQANAKPTVLPGQHTYVLSTAGFLPDIPYTISVEAGSEILKYASGAGGLTGSTGFTGTKNTDLPRNQVTFGKWTGHGPSVTHILLSRQGSAGTWFETAYAIWKGESVDGYRAYVRTLGAFDWRDNSPITDWLVDWKEVDAQLVRKVDPARNTWRVDIPGLPRGEYEIQVRETDGVTVRHTFTDLETWSFPRNGAAFVPSNANSYDGNHNFALNGATGGYLPDGRVDPDAKIIYVTHENMSQTLPADVFTANRGSTANARTPLVIRFLGTVGSFETVNSTVAGSGTVGPVWLNNNRMIQVGQGNGNVTLEGIGPDATIFGWGISTSGAHNVVFRNLNFDQWFDDAIEINGANTTVRGSNVWVHNNTFGYGQNKHLALNQDPDQAKGDGATDVTNHARNYTVSYNKYAGSSKVLLIGGGTGSISAHYGTLHHNRFMGSEERTPRVRNGRVHAFNNLYEDIQGHPYHNTLLDRNTGYGIGAAHNATIWAEGNIFDNVNFPFLRSRQGHARGHDPIDSTTGSGYNHFFGDAPGFIVAREVVTEGDFPNGIEGFRQSSDYMTGLTETGLQELKADALSLQPNIFDEASRKYFDPKLDIGIVVAEGSTATNPNMSTNPAAQLDWAFRPNRSGVWPTETPEQVEALRNEIDTYVGAMPASAPDAAPAAPAISSVTINDEVRSAFGDPSSFIPAPGKIVVYKDTFTIDWVSNDVLTEHYEIQWDKGSNQWETIGTVPASSRPNTFITQEIDQFANLQAILAQASNSATYAFRIKAVNSLGESDWSDVYTVNGSERATDDTAAPVWPVGSTLKASNTTETGTTLTWTAATDNVGVTGYKVYQGSTELTTVASSGSSYKVTGLKAGTSYTFAVQAGDAAGNWSTNGPSVTVTTVEDRSDDDSSDTPSTPAPPTIPTAPTTPVTPEKPSTPAAPAPVVTTTSGQPAFDLSKPESVSLLKEVLEEKVRSSGKSVTFDDVSNHWSAESVRVFSRLGVVNGYEDGTFKPDANITRGEFAAIVAKTFNIGTGELKAVSFKDINESWAKDAIMALASNGIINGYEDGTFQPGANITRAEMIAMISRIINLNTVQGPSNIAFNDIDKWNKAQIEAAAKAGIINGLGEGSFAPGKNSTRAEALTVLLRSLQLNPEIASLLNSMK
jgi:exo-poly-alpha-galacturonosidase